MILFAQRLHDFAQLELRIDLVNQFLNHLFALAVTAFPEVAKAQVAILIEQVFGGPVAVGERFPYLAIAVDHHRIGQPKLANAAIYVRFILREGKLRRVHADHSQSLVPIALMPGLHVRQSSNAVDASVIPEIHEHDTPAQLPETERSGIQPHSSNFRRSYRALFNSQDFSNLFPTSSAQY